MTQWVETFCKNVYTYIHIMLPKIVFAFTFIVNSWVYNHSHQKENEIGKYDSKYVTNSVKQRQRWLATQKTSIPLDFCQGYGLAGTENCTNQLHELNHHKKHHAGTMSYPLLLFHAPSNMVRTSRTYMVVRENYYQIPQGFQVKWYQLIENIKWLKGYI